MDKKLKIAQIRSASPIKRIVPIGLEGQLYGTEKIWDSPSLGIDRTIEQIRSFNFYNSQCSEKDARAVCCLLSVLFCFFFTETWCVGFVEHKLIRNPNKGIHQ